MNQNQTFPVIDDPEAVAAEILALEASLDQALADTFPASDPPALLRRGSSDAERGPGPTAGAV
jgi:hypothetical protein